MKGEREEICAIIYVDNPDSIRLAERLGFWITGSAKEVFRGKDYPHHKYSLYLNQDKDMIYLLLHKELLKMLIIEDCYLGTIPEIKLLKDRTNIIPYGSLAQI